MVLIQQLFVMLISMLNYNNFFFRHKENIKLLSKGSENFFIFFFPHIFIYFSLKLQLAGKIVAPNDPNEWKGKDLLAFEEVHGLTINGFGTIDGRGQAWWDVSCRFHPQLKVYISLSNFPKKKKLNIYHLCMV